MTKAMTALQKDQLITDAAAAGLKVTRTSKDFTLHHPKSGQRRVTPGELRGLIAEAEELARAEALEAADEIRAQEEAGVTVTSEEPQAAPVQAQEAEEAPAPAPTPAAAEQSAQKAPKAEKAARAVTKYGPPCGGDIAHLSVATSADARNPLMHLAHKPKETHKNKEEAAAAGRRSKSNGWIAFLAQDATGEQYWVVATLNEAGVLTLDGQAVDLQLLEGKAAEAARAKVKAPRLQAKSQWVATAM